MKKNTISHWLISFRKIQSCELIQKGQEILIIIKKALQHRCFPVKFGTFLRTRFLQNTSGGYLGCRFIAYQNRKSRLVQMQTLQKRSERNRLSLLQRGECNAYCLGYNHGVRGRISPCRFQSNYLTVSNMCLLYLPGR